MELNTVASVVYSYGNIVHCYSDCRTGTHPVTATKKRIVIDDDFLYGVIGNACCSFVVTMHMRRGLCIATLLVRLGIFIFLLCN